MPSDQEMERTTAQLAGFRAENTKHQATLTDMLDKYATLIEDYKRLQSDFEEARDSRERYKQMARGQDRNPFVLVLVDGDGYIFDDELIASGAEGGQRAAHLLNQAVQDSLRSRGLDHCRVMVRVYANLTGLSKALSKCKLAGPEKRSLAPFVADFNRSNELFDFVDAGELKENADFKIRAALRLYAENPQCRHIFFAGCHDVGYVSELTAHHENRDRITLVRSSSFHPEFNKLGMRIEGFPNVFRLTPLDTNIPTSAKTQKQQSAEPGLAAPRKEGGTICTFYQKGACRYGKDCTFRHVPRTGSNETSSQALSAESNDWRQHGSGPKQGTPFQMASLTKSDNDFMNGNKFKNEISAQHPTNFAQALPRAENIPPGTIPVNKAQQRLDAYQSSLPAEWWQAFNSRTASQGLCNNHHLSGYCSNYKCAYDHSPVSPAILECLNQKAKGTQCSRRGGCRTATCVLGHVCQKADCKFRGGKFYCKLNASAHQVDPQVATYVPAESSQGSHADTSSYHGGNASSSLTEAVSDEEGQEGAPLAASDHDSLD